MLEHAKQTAHQFIKDATECFCAIALAAIIVALSPLGWIAIICLMFMMRR